MGRSSYREQDRVFGQLMLRLRTAIRLSQTALGALLGVSRHAVASWEAGQTYPKTSHLKQFIELCVEQDVYAVGREAEEIRVLWRAARQKILIDEQWLEDLLSRQNHQVAQQSPAAHRHEADAHPELKTPDTSLLDWGDALDVPTFYGRDTELAMLAGWLVEDRCRVVSVLGIGGIGKSALAVTVMRQVAANFDAVIWRSLRDIPAPEMLLDTCFQVLIPQSLSSTFDSLDIRLSLLMGQLRSRRVLLVLDNGEVLLEEGTGRVKASYRGYARLIRQIATTSHQSCLILTSREQFAELVPLEGLGTPVRALRLAGLDRLPCTQLLSDKRLIGSPSEQERLVELYSGNPLALKIVAQMIADLFGGELSPFLAQGETIFGGVRKLIDEQFDRLSALEQTMFFWLAILREPINWEGLVAMLHQPQAPALMLEALDGLVRRSLIERGQQAGSFTLQSVVLEYATARLVAEARVELAEGRLEHLIRYGLTHAQAKEYVRRAQEQMLMLPLLQQMQRAYPEPADLEAHFLTLLDHLRSQHLTAHGYAPANLVVLLRLLRGDLRGLNLSRLALRGTYLHGVAMQDVDLSEAALQDSVLTEAFDGVLALAVSSSGTHWAAVSRRGEVRVWDGAGRTLQHIWHAYTADMLWQHLAFNPDGRSLACGSQSRGEVKVWNVLSGALIWAKSLTRSITWLAFSPDGRMLATAGLDAVVRFWDSRDGTLIEELPHASALWSLAWSPDGQLIATGDVTGTMRLWRIQSDEPTRCVQTLIGHDHWVTSLAFGAQGTQLASASFDGTVKLWDVASGGCTHIFTGHAERVIRVAWSGDGQTIASAGLDRTIWLWDVTARRARAVLQGHTAVVNTLAFTPHGSTLLSGSDDGTIRVWDVDRRQCVRVIGGHVNSIIDIDWSPDSKQLASGGADTLVTLWDIAGAAARRELHGHGWIVHGVAWQPAGRLLASGALETFIGIWDTVTGALLHQLRDPAMPDTLFQGVAWSPDGRLLACGSYLRGVQVWDIATLTQRWVGHVHASLVRRVAWSAGGTQLAAVDNSGVISLWNASDGSQQRQLAGHDGAVMSVAWSPDGRLLATGGGGKAGGELKIWDAQSGEQMYALTGHMGVIAALAWSVDGELLISGGSDGMLRWWELKSEAHIRAQATHQGAVHTLKCSPSGLLASCGNDGTIVLWDVQSGEQLQTLRRDRPYERMLIDGITGITEAQRASLLTLGAVNEQYGSAG